VSTRTVSIEELNAMLAPIVGQPLTDMWRGGGQIFEFGEQLPWADKKGIDQTRARYHVKFLGEWQISQAHKVVMGSRDHRTKRRFYDRVREPKEPDSRDIWRVAKEFLGKVKAGELRVVSAEFEDSGLIQIKLTQNFVLIGLSCSAENEDALFWMDSELDESHLILWNQDGFVST
jgi:hypothetical protein